MPASPGCRADARTDAGGGEEIDRRQEGAGPGPATVQDRLRRPVPVRVRPGAHGPGGGGGQPSRIGDDPGERRPQGASGAQALGDRPQGQCHARDPRRGHRAVHRACQCQVNSPPKAAKQKSPLSGADAQTLGSACRPQGLGRRDRMHPIASKAARPWRRQQ